MTRLEIEILRKDMTSQLAEIRALRELVLNMLPRLTAEISDMHESVAALINELPCRVGYRRKTNERKSK